MITKRFDWQQKLAIIDRTMKAISGVTDPEELVHIYWTNISELISMADYLALSRRDVEPPGYLITRSSRFTEHYNPWTHRDRLPRFSGGLLGEIAYANKPIIIEDLPSRLKPDDPAHFYLQGFQSLVALPQYDQGEGLNVTVPLFPPGMEMEHDMIPMLHWQSGLFGRGTTNLVLRNQLASTLKTLERELQVVGEIQRSLLPSALPNIPGVELSTFYQTSARAGGDYYDFFPLHHDQWGIFIADVAGHGTPAAVLMAITHAIAHARPGTHTPPCQLLKYLNSHLTRSYTRGATFVTAFYAVFDPGSRTLTYSTAGHNPPRLVRGDQVLSLDHPDAMALPLGILDEQPYGQSSVTLQHGDLLLLYTDGITEAMAPRQAPDKPRELFGTTRLDELLLSCKGCTAQECITRIRADVATFTANAAQGDDQTLVAMRCLD
jgi:sigma-B regulation protein RsbU (phosphoserine phosphatase)